jgi:hypothetical protein
MVIMVLICPQSRSFAQTQIYSESSIESTNFFGITDKLLIIRLANSGTQREVALGPLYESACKQE